MNPHTFWTERAYCASWFIIIENYFSEASGDEASSTIEFEFSVWVLDGAIASGVLSSSQFELGVGMVFGENEKVWTAFRDILVQPAGTPADTGSFTVQVWIKG